MSVYAMIDWEKWIVYIGLMVSGVLLVVCFIGLGNCFWKSYKENRDCLKWQRTLVNVPAHMVGKIMYPESVREGEVCVQWRDGTR